MGDPLHKTGNMLSFDMKTGSIVECKECEKIKPAEKPALF
jgi:hypothetical protein